MSWIIAAISLALAGLAVLAFLTVRVLRAAAELGREVDRTEGRLEPVRVLFGERTATVRGQRDEYVSWGAYDREQRLHVARRKDV
ncbi:MULTISPECIES: hypothetical protein [unclassified Streptosporangium]|uniref:hypothetical protein n=1 Tax=unclassified Streptosporangium TaxID=2632669 RepID=UPI002E27EC47|nr:MULTISPECIES: hypothetical protein [unclassified Streptosporangium]